MATKAQKLREIKENPSLAMMRVIDDAERAAKRVVTEEMAELRTEMRKEMESMNPNNAGFIEQIIQRAVSRLVKDTKGDKGDQGEKGDIGSVGPQGESIQGPKGDDAQMKGDTGEKGERGDVGQDGKAGTQGQPGRDGTPGTTGKNGAETFTEEMREKLKSFPTFKEVQRLITETAQTVARREGARGGSKGGGGMGNPQHETFDVGSSTTTITVTQPIAAEGFALWVYYQGQFLVKDTHYTVGGNNRTLTLLFTPTDSTNIDITYVRGT